MNYTDLVDHAALAAAEERHLGVRRRLDAAQQRLVEAEAERAAVAKAHDLALAGDGGDPRETAKALADADAALRLAKDAPAAIEGAIRRSETALRGEVAAAHRAMRDAAVADLLRVAQTIDKLRHDLAGAVRHYAAVTVALDRARASNLTAPGISAVPPHVGDMVRQWADLPADRDVYPHLAAVCRGHHPETAAIADTVAVEIEGAAQ